METAKFTKALQSFYEKIKSLEVLVTIKYASNALREKCPIRSFFWSVFSLIRTEYRDLQTKSPCAVRIRENTDQKKLRVWALFTCNICKQLTQTIAKSKTKLNKWIHDKIKYVIQKQQALGLRLHHRFFSCEYYEVFKNSFRYRTPLVAAFGISRQIANETLSRAVFTTNYDWAVLGK